MHTGGEPLRIILEGYPELESRSILNIRTQLTEEYDHVRKFLMWEPRGHSDMYGLLKVDPERADSAFGVLVMHKEGYSTMCGHATIAIGKAAVDLGWVEKTSPISTFKIDAPCGQLEVFVQIENNEATEVSFLNVPSFYVGTYEIEFGEYGMISYDIAYGGAFYAYADIDQFNLSCVTENGTDLIRIGKQLKAAIIAANQDIHHPFESELSFLYGCIFTEAVDTPSIHSKNVCIFADGELDRSATGSGVSGRAAILHHKGELHENESIRIESIIGSYMDVEIHSVVPYGKSTAIIPKVSGRAYYTGEHHFWMDPNDPLKDGFLIG